MAGLQIPQVLVVFGAIVALNCVSAMPRVCMKYLYSPELFTIKRLVVNQNCFFSEISEAHRLSLFLNKIYRSLQQPTRKISSHSCSTTKVTSATDKKDIVSLLLYHKDIIFPTADENLAGNPELAAYQPSVNDQPIKMHEQEDKPKSCFHFYVSRNMSSLLAEATKMLRTIRDRREREWILTFIYRIKSLAEHLRAHPNSRNYDCLPTDEETKKRLLSDNAKGQPQPELYFVDDVPKRSEEGEDILEEADETKASDNQEPNSTSSVQAQSILHVPKDPESDLKPPPSQTLSSAETASDNTLTDSNDEEKDIPTSKLDAAAESPIDDSAQKDDNENSSDKKEQTDGGNIVFSSAPDCDANAKCKSNDDTSSSHKSRENYFADAGNIYPLYQPDVAKILEEEQYAEELYQQKALKERIRKALLEELAPEIKKLKTVGGTEEDLKSIWNSRYIQNDKSVEENEEADFDYEETGAAVGDLNLNDNVHPDRTVAPSLDEVQNSKEHLNHPKDSSYEPYDDSDVLVQQLFDVRYNNNNNPSSKSTKPFNDQNNEYLITSTHTSL